MGAVPVLGLTRAKSSALKEKRRAGSVSFSVRRHREGRMRTCADSLILVMGWRRKAQNLKRLSWTSGKEGRGIVPCASVLEIVEALLACLPSPRL